MKKEFELKNNKVIYLSFTSGKNFYALTAFNRIGEIVGHCIFKIFTQTSKKIYSTAKNKYVYFAINKNTLCNETSCHIIKDKRAKNSYCELLDIKIFDQNYFNVGLGKAMLSTMEDFCKKQNCQRIYGIFHPNSESWYGARKFYARNGYSFENNGGLIYLKKELVLGKEKK